MLRLKSSLVISIDDQLIAADGNGGVVADARREYCVLWEKQLILPGLKLRLYKYNTEVALSACLDAIVLFGWPIQMTISFLFKKVWAERPFSTTGVYFSILQSLQEESLPKVFHGVTNG